MTFTFPYSHGLLALILWGGLFGMLVARVHELERRRVFWIVAALVVSHFVLDGLSLAEGEVLKHGLAEEGVGAGLVAFAVFAEPGDNVGVEAQGELFLERAVVGVADGVFPEFCG